jgi:hypothetical protein
MENTEDMEVATAEVNKSWISVNRRPFLGSVIFLFGCRLTDFFLLSRLLSL